MEALDIVFPVYSAIFNDKILDHYSSLLANAIEQRTGKVYYIITVYDTSIKISLDCKVGSFPIILNNIEVKCKFRYSWVFYTAIDYTLNC